MWDYPRPPRAERVRRRVRIVHGGTLVLDTDSSSRFLGWLWSFGRSSTSKNVELLVLRHGTLWHCVDQRQAFHNVITQ